MNGKIVFKIIFSIIGEGERETNWFAINNRSITIIDKFPNIIYLFIYSLI